MTCPTCGSVLSPIAERQFRAELSRRGSTTTERKREASRRNLQRANAAKLGQHHPLVHRQRSLSSDSTP